MLQIILKKVFGTQNERTLKQMWPIVQRINDLEPSMEQLSTEQLRAKTDEFRKRLSEGAKLDDLLEEAFAVVRETSKRVLKMRHFDVQLLGGIVLHRGQIAEMSTGEGKTLVATLPAYLNGLTGKGTHVITVNDYLAERDCHWMGPVYETLGLSVGVIKHDLPPEERRNAYACDITYGTNNEFGFDYLRDNMVPTKEGRVQRKLNFCIVDEVDSILIDEARTPLIISGPTEESTEKYYKANRAVKRFNGYKIEKEEVDPEWKEKLNELKQQYDYIADEKAKTITLTESGETKGAEGMGVDNLHDAETVDERHQIITAIRAKEFFQIDVDYVVNDGEIIIVDEFTGRLMPGRRFSDGLHQALEAKEGVNIRRENQTLATITFQNYFRMYEKLSGMTGTAATEAVEFANIYKLHVVVMPTNKPCVRNDQADCIYRTEREKFNAVAEEIKNEHEKGRPVLVGTISIERSERLSQILRRYNLPHQVLNAKYHEREAEIITGAGQRGTITIATNMAGRGTDIVLGEGVRELGGLCVIGTERHESRRIDNQLRGRCGRQGDPGSTKFYIALEDELMRLFGSDRIAGLMQKLGMEEGEEIQHPLVSRAIETAQKRVETRNFEIRKHLLEYDDVMNRQRELIYEERNRVLEGKDIGEHVLEMIEDIVESLLAQYVHPDWRSEDKNYDGLVQALEAKFSTNFKETVHNNQDDFDDMREEILKKIKKHYGEREREFGPERMNFLACYLLLQNIDNKWKEHLHSLDSLKEGIGLRAYGQRNPLNEYKSEAFAMFQHMIDSIKEETIDLLFRVRGVHEEKMSTVLDASSAEYVHPDSQGMATATQAEKLSQRKSARPMPSGLSAIQEQSNRQGAPEPVKRSGDKVGRNDPCPCGSGKKYKKCCGK